MLTSTRTDVVTPTRPPWRQCHGSSLLVTRSGRVLVAYFAGDREGDPASRIELVCRGLDGTWAPPAILSSGTEARWNPVLAHGPDGRIWLFAKAGSPISQWRTVVRTSADEGVSFDEERELVPGDRGGRGPVKNPPVLLDDGTWLAGASIETAPGPSGATARWDAFVDRSTDGGATWAASLIDIDHETFIGAGAIQPTLWATGPRAATALLRTTAGRAWRSVTTDAGATWSRAEPTGLPNNNSGLCAVRLPSGRVVCAHNPSDVAWGPRNELVLSVSDDDGRTWQRLLTLDALPDAGTALVAADAGVVTDGQGEISYPTVCIDEGPGDLLVSYTWQRREIRLATLTLDPLRETHGLAQP